MNVLLAENAGFCFGVKRAVDEAIKTQKQFNKKIYTLGPLIHNGDVVRYLEENSIYAIDLNDIDTLSKGDVILIRSHGVSKKTFDDLNEKGLIVIFNKKLINSHVKDIKLLFLAMKNILRLLVLMVGVIMMP